MAIVPVTGQVPIPPAAACGSGGARGLWPPGDRPGRVSSPLLVPQPWPSSYHRLRRTAGGDADAGERLHGYVAGGRPVPVGPQGGGTGRLPARPPPPPVGGGEGGVRSCRRRPAAGAAAVSPVDGGAVGGLRLGAGWCFKKLRRASSSPAALAGSVHFFSSPSLHPSTATCRCRLCTLLPTVVPSVVCSFCLVDDLWGVAPIFFSPA